MPPRKRLGQLLLELKAVDEHQLQSALGHQKQWGGKLGTILVQKGFIREDEMVRVLSQHVGMPQVKLSDAKVDARAVKLISKQLAEKLQVFAFDVTGQGRAEVVTVAMSDPTDLAAVDQLAFHTGKRIRAVLSGATEIVAAIHKHYDGRVMAAPPGMAKGPLSAPPARPGQPAASAPPPPPQPAPVSHGFGRISPLPPPGTRPLPPPNINNPTLVDFRPSSGIQPLPMPPSRRPEPPRAPPPTMAPSMVASQPVRPAPYVPPLPPPPIVPVARAPLPPPEPPPPLQEIEPQFGGEQFDAAQLEAPPPPPPEPQGDVIEGLEPIAASTLDEGPSYVAPGSSGLELDEQPPPASEQHQPPPAELAASAWVNTPEQSASTPEWSGEPAPAAEGNDWENAETAPQGHAPLAQSWEAAPPPPAPEQPQAEEQSSEWAAAPPAAAAEPAWDAAPLPSPAPAPSPEEWRAAPAAEPAAAPQRDAAFGEAPADWSASEPQAEQWPAVEAPPAEPPPPPVEASWDAAPAAAAAEPAWDAQQAEAPPAPAWDEQLPAEAIMGEAQHEPAAAAAATAEPPPAEAAAEHDHYATPPPPPPEAIDESAEAAPPAEHTEAEAPPAWGAVEDPLAAHHAGEQSAAAADTGTPAGWEDMHLAADLTPPAEAPPAAEQPAEAAAEHEPAAAEAPAEHAEAQAAPPPAAGEELDELTFSDDELREPEPAVAETPAAAEVAPPAEAAAAEADQAAPPAEAVAPNGESEPLQGWVAPPSEEAASGAGWLGEALAATSPLSAAESGTLLAAGIDPNDGAGALRLIAALLRVLHRRQLIDIEELAAEVRAARSEAPPDPAQAAAPEGEQATSSEAPAHPAE